MQKKCRVLMLKQVVGLIRIPILTCSCLFIFMIYLKTAPISSNHTKRNNKVISEQSV